MGILLPLVLAMSLDPFLSAIVTRELAQYPDVHLYKAAAMLQPEERPTVPVRLFDPNDGTYERVLASLGVQKSNPRVRAFVDPDHTTIYVNRKRGDGWNDAKTAATLAHEQRHIADKEGGEGSAYAREVEVLRRLSRRIRSEDLEAAMRLAEEWKRK